MLKPERLKEIEEILHGYDLRSDVYSCIEDLLIERNQVILPAFSKFVVDTKGCLLQPGEEKEIMGRYFQEQWETFM